MTYGMELLLDALLVELWLQGQDQRQWYFCCIKSRLVDVSGLLRFLQPSITS
jgi:hypothetical protein